MKELTPNKPLLSSIKEYLPTLKTKFERELGDNLNQMQQLIITQAFDIFTNQMDSHSPITSFPTPEQRADVFQETVALILYYDSLFSKVKQLPFVDADKKLISTILRTYKHVKLYFKEQRVNYEQTKQVLIQMDKYPLQNSNNPNKKLTTKQKNMKPL